MDLTKIKEENKRYVDGCVLIQHKYAPSGYAGHEKLKTPLFTVCDQHGNIWYKNCANEVEACYKVRNLEDKGKKAVLGPVAPTKQGYSNKDRLPNGVGIYLVEESENDGQES